MEANGPGSILKFWGGTLDQSSATHQTEALIQCVGCSLPQWHDSSTASQLQHYQEGKFVTDENFSSINYTFFQRFYWSVKKYKNVIFFF